MLKIGDTAPDFSLQDQSGLTHQISDYRGQWVLLYFYPKDMTPGCTTQACTLRDVWDEFKQLDTVILGISTDSVDSHRKFAEKHQLPFTLLADCEKKVVQQYRVWGERSFMGKKYMGTARTSFLVNPEGVIEKIYEKVKPMRHALDVLGDLRALREV